MKYFLLGLALASSLLFTGCATTPSKPLSFEQLGQYSTTPLNVQTYRISFLAGHNMSFGTAEEITLVKAAQTTLQHGFRLFKVLDDPSNRSQKPPRQAVVYPAPSYYPYSYSPYGYYHRRAPFWPDPFYDMPQVVTLDPTQVSYTIQCFKDQKSAPEDAFDASLILQSLGAKYGLSPTGQPLTPPSSAPTAP